MVIRRRINLWTSFGSRHDPNTRRRWRSQARGTSSHPREARLPGEGQRKDPVQKLKGHPLRTIPESVPLPSVPTLKLLVHAVLSSVYPLSSSGVRSIVPPWRPPTWTAASARRHSSSTAPASAFRVRGPSAEPGVPGGRIRVVQEGRVAKSQLRPSVVGETDRLHEDFASAWGAHVGSTMRRDRYAETERGVAASRGRSTRRFEQAHGSRPSGAAASAAGLSISPGVARYRVRDQTDPADLC